MASITLTVAPSITSGTVSIYPRAAWSGSGAPSGAAVTTAVVSSRGSIALTNLTNSGSYVAYQANPDRVVQFRVDVPNGAVRILQHTPTDADFSVVPPDGTAAIDITAGTEYVRVEGAWTPLPSDPRAPAPPNYARPVYVSGVSGNDGNDGRSWSTAKKTIGAAVTALTGTGGHIFVFQSSYVETVTLNSAGIRIIGMGGGASKMPLIQAPNATANCVEFNAELSHIENFILKGYGTGSAWTGTALKCTGAGDSTAVNLSIVNDVDATAVSGGTGISIGGGTEKARFTDIFPSNLALAIELRSEGTTSIFENVRPSACRKEIDMPGTSLAGGCLFIGYKSGQGGQREHVGGTDDFTHKTVNINGPGNTFLNCDWSESHNIFHEVSSDHNFFINCSLAPGSRLDVTGTYNTLIGYDVQGSLFVSGNHNKLDGVWPHLGDVTVTGTANIVGHVREDQRAVLGSGYLRSVLSDTTDTNRSMLLARTVTVPGDSLPRVFEPALWLVADDIAGADGDPVLEWQDRSQAAGTCSTANAGRTVTNLVATSGRFAVGQFVRGVGIPAGTQIKSIDYPNQTAVISAPATADGTGIAVLAGRDSLTQPTAAARPTIQVAELNGHRTVRWDSVPNDFLYGSVVIPYKQAIVVCKYTPATFGGNVGLLTSSTAGPSAPNDVVLAGSSGGTVFNNDVSVTTDYTLNNTGYAEGAMAAPVGGVWGIAAISNPVGWGSIVQLGNDRDTGRYWNGDVAEVILLPEILSATNATAAVRALGTKYGITVA